MGELTQGNGPQIVTHDPVDGRGKQSGHVRKREGETYKNGLASGTRPENGLGAG